MKKFGWIILTVGLLAYSVGKELMRPSSSGLDSVNVPQVADKTMSDLASGAQAHHSELPSAQGMAEEANERASAKMRAVGPGERVRIAAASFLGFYIANADEIPEICRGEGVNISQYVEIFKTEHAQLFDKAKSSLASEGMEYEAYRAAIRRAGPQTRPVLAKSLEELAATVGKSSVRDGCLFVTAHSADVAAAQHIKNVNPDVYRQLASAAP
jgi:hypothetical protein